MFGLVRFALLPQDFIHSTVMAEPTFSTPRACKLWFTQLKDLFGGEKPQQRVGASPSKMRGTTNDNLRRCCRLQDRGAVQERSERRWRGITHRCGRREARLARGGIREHDAFWGHEMRGPAGTGCCGVSVAGGREGQGARKGNARMG